MKVVYRRYMVMGSVLSGYRDGKWTARMLGNSHVDS